MESIRNIRRQSIVCMTALAIAAGSVFAMASATPANAFDSRTAARSFTKQLYGAAGTRICGRKCGSIGRQMGGRAFDTGSRFSNWYSGKTRAAGRALRGSYCRRSNRC